MQESIKNWLKNNWFKILAIIFSLGALNFCLEGAGIDPNMLHY
jgi:hypothetical protein